MNVKLLLSIAALATAAGSAFAESPTVDTPPFTSAKSRAQVQAELLAYKQAGVNPWSTSYNPLRGFKSATTREEVVAAYLAARDEVAAVHGEDGGSAYYAQGRTPRLAAGTVLAGQPVTVR